MNQAFSKIWIIVVFLLLIGGGVFALQYFGIPKEEVKTPKAVVKEAIKDEIADWQTYRNEEFGFEVKYPQDFMLQDNEGAVSFCGGEAAEFCGIRGASYHAEVYLSKVIKDERESLYSFVFDGGEFLGYDPWPFGKHPNTVDCQVIPIKVDGVDGKLWRCDYNTGFGGLQAFWQGQDEDSFYRMSVSLSDEFPGLKDTFNQILSTFRFVENEKVVLPITCKDELESVPVITSISPVFGSVGTKVEIKGCNLAGFEGDLDTVFVRIDGAEIPLYGGTWYPGYGGAELGKLIKVTVQSYCESGYVTGRYSGITSPCETIMATPGIYKVYVDAWGKKSNEVSFTIR